MQQGVRGAFVKQPLQSVPLFRAEPNGRVAAVIVTLGQLSWCGATQSDGHRSPIVSFHTRECLSLCDIIITGTSPRPPRDCCDSWRPGPTHSVWPDPFSYIDEGYMMAVHHMCHLCSPEQRSLIIHIIDRCSLRPALQRLSAGWSDYYLRLSTGLRGQWNKTEGVQY